MSKCPNFRVHQRTVGVGGSEYDRCRHCGKWFEGDDFNDPFPPAEPVVEKCDNCGQDKWEHGLKGRPDYGSGVAYVSTDEGRIFCPGYKPAEPPAVRERDMEDAAFDFLDERNPNYADEAGPEVFHWMAAFAAEKLSALVRDVEAELDRYVVNGSFVYYSDLIEVLQNVLTERGGRG